MVVIIFSLQMAVTGFGRLQETAPKLELSISIMKTMIESTMLQGVLFQILTVAVEMVIRAGGVLHCPYRNGGLDAIDNVTE